MNIFLIGPMGAGKSTIGRMLSQELSLDFVDVDREIEERAGANIPWIFDVEGEDGFRDREEAVVDELTLKDQQVLATGGGAVLRAANRACLQSRGFVVYLDTSVEQQLERTSKDKNRPLLNSPDPQAVLEKLMLIRDPLYIQTSDLIVKTDRRHPRGVVTEIVKQLVRQGIIAGD
ncbi:shikimate kinase AroK [Neptunomonas qingdaonensis]|uniref:Shikimate kinase n=1 Tax=Neptunomonas qingdaonensis TaxID=1045558 RepID=A0A1I2M525_9GAMM|nr:shikimate kinase AroK [Neptunomonas qingdaonensis]SFF86603.1 shikimate kinase [Neptunomonas qingdaonensis]